MSIDIITILDTETTGFKPSGDKIIELAAILYSLKQAAPIACFSSLIPHTSNDAARANGISVELLATTPDKYATFARNSLNAFAADSAALVAHNAAFDRNFINAAEVLTVKKDLPWVCTMNHIAWPKVVSSKSLMAIAVAHGVAITAAHRAMTDCDILARLLTRVHELGHSLPDMFERAMTPRTLVQALVSYHDRQLAKDANFRWDEDEEHPKKWLRECTAEELVNLPFRCVPV